MRQIFRLIKKFEHGYVCKLECIKLTDKSHYDSYVTLNIKHYVTLNVILKIQNLFDNKEMK